MRRWHGRSWGPDPRASGLAALSRFAALLCALLSRFAALLSRFGALLSRFAALLCAVLCALLWTLTARAAPTVLLLRVDDDEAAHRWRAAERRAHDELRALGLAVAELSTEDPDRREGEVAQWMTERGATAAIRLERGLEAGDARIWLLDARGRVRTLQLAALSLEGGEAATIAALRAVEAVHAGLLELAEADSLADASLPLPGLSLPPPDIALPPPDFLLPPPPPDFSLPPPPDFSLPPPPPPAVPDAKGDPHAPLRVPAPPRTSPPRARIDDPPRARAGQHAFGVHATVGGGPGGPGALTGLELAYRRALPRVVSVQVELLGAVTPGWQTQGLASVVMGLGGARALLVVQPRQDRVVTPRLGLGGGGALVWAVGRAPAPLRAARDVSRVWPRSRASPPWPCACDRGCAWWSAWASTCCCRRSSCGSPATRPRGSGCRCCAARSASSGRGRATGRAAARESPVRVQDPTAPLATCPEGQAPAPGHSPSLTLTLAMRGPALASPRSLAFSYWVSASR
jgi:hypothetical protein